MKLGIFAKTFPGTDPAPVLRAVRDCGYSVAQYNMACSGLPSMPDAVPEEAARAVTAAAAEAGVGLAALSATYNMIHPDPAERQRGHERLAVLAQAARQMGVGLLTLCTGTRDPEDQWRRHPDNATPQAWRDLGASMEVAIAIAEAHDLDLGIEPERANVVDSAARARRLVDELQSPRVKIVIDAANLWETEPADERRAIIADAIDTLADRIVMAHAKDRTADGAFATAGKGAIDFADYLRRLHSAGFDGPLVTHGLAADEAPEVARYLARLLDEAGAA
jgi:sugar phosphate isomerase/epimerase